MKREKCFLLGFLNSVMMAYCFAQAPVKTAVIDKLHNAQLITMGGFVGEKLNASYENRVLAQDINRLVEPFRNRTETRCWQSEFWGKWFTSAVLAYKYRPEPRLKDILDKAVSELIATQTTDGYIGNLRKQANLNNGMSGDEKYCMLGLLAYYDFTKDDKSLQAAKEVANNLMEELAGKKILLVKKGNHRGMAATSVLEPICNLYAITKKKKNTWILQKK